MNKHSELWKDLGGKWSDKYWKHDNTRGRQLVDYFKDKNVTSFLEVGCNSGRNLYYLHKNLPDKKLSGIEISPKAAEDARKHLPTAAIYENDIHDIDAIHKYDVVFTGGVLMHIEPKMLPSVIEKCVELAKQYVVHMEPTGKDIITHGPKELNPLKVKNKLRCLHDIERVYVELGYTVTNKPNYLGSSEAFIVLDLRSKK
jgi:SAM-dependent methyltransferase